jgi:hypothetical protein
MKYLIIVSMTALMVLSGCAVSLRGGHGHYRHRSYRHHGHHRHHHWNSPGPAYIEANRIENLTILPATLPDDFDGEYSSDQESTWRKDWPLRGSELVADAMEKGTEGRVKATVSDSKPSKGYYMTVTVTYLDLGDPTMNADGTPKARGTALAAHGVIMNAESNEMVAEVKFSESSGWTGNNMFEVHMARVGTSLANWLNEKQGEK